MRSFGVLLAGLALVCAASGCEAYSLHSSSASLMEFPLFKKSATKTEDKAKDKSGGKKKRGLWSKLRGSVKRKREAQQPAEDSDDENPEEFKKKRKQSWIERRKHKRQKRTHKERKTDDSRVDESSSDEEEHGHQRHHKDVTDEIHEHIEEDQREPSHVEPEVKEALRTISSTVKRSLISSIADDIDHAWNKLLGRHRK
ncbi:hypothetical protein BBBOND_0311700 [Babesia bigemina]|uniref:Uncharacterized protein n=1 Tax=Babesia bigemina TaxID=5866 RepID=A0A061DBB8_BABBI|nr:hypothetical protein BBBOND_0311700 [Babesia bigemina]CDR97267.1 hypothetical protein BBBOND_0311700 [Babesia bigemina]|eukprot:XP_012769453.1 hypothetical protein BBBOND_0311700 [Babesia bigemina]